MDDELLFRYLTGDLSGQEAEDIRLSLENDPAGREYLAQMEKMWKLSGSIENFQRIDLAGDWNVLRERIAFSKPSLTLPAYTKTRSLTLRVVRVAALILLALAAGFMIHYYTGHGTMGRLDWMSLDAQDQIKELTLPDGSHVFLNEGSSLTYPAQFKGRKRIVRLDGEGFFEVARSEDKAFIIHVSDMATAEVLGTSFNLKEDPGKKKVQLNVLSGKVSFFPRGKKRQAIVLHQDEQAECHQGTIRQQLSLDLNFLSWKTRKLVFENTPLPEVTKQLGRHYRKQFIINDPGIDTLALTGTYQNQEMEDVLEEISLVLEIIFTEKDGMIHVTTMDGLSHEE
jgi:ferric-dicitrate binding protein FerR (iron transport regulator)